VKFSSALPETFCDRLNNVPELSESANAEVFFSAAAARSKRLIGRSPRPSI
jgi:hypothetical protein